MAKKLTIQEIEDLPGSKIKLRCIKAYHGSYNVGPGQIMHYDYKVGDVLPRSQIMLLPGSWERAE